MIDIIIVAVLLVIIGAAVIYILKEKKKGVKCIGCPFSGQCSHKCSGAGGEDCKCSE